jgi:glutamine amidotransferase
MFMHNGGVGAWKFIKRKLANDIAEKWFLGVQGGTDSEWVFALFLDTLERQGLNPSLAPAGGFGHVALRKAMLRTIERINSFIDGVSTEQRAQPDFEPISLLNIALTDGHTVICTRYVSSKTQEAASLYFSSGTKWTEYAPGGYFTMERKDKGADIVLVASEPLTFERGKMHTCSSFSITR